MLLPERVDVGVVYHQMNLCLCIFGCFGHGWVRRFEQRLHGEKGRIPLKDGELFLHLS